MSDYLAVSKVADVFIGVTDSAKAMRDEALALALEITTVENQVQCHMAGDALNELKQIRIGVEKSRKAVKEPVLELGRKIDKTAADFLVDVEKAEKRIQAALSTYAAEQLTIQREAERKAKAEADRIEQDRIKALQDAQKKQQEAIAEARRIDELARQEQDAAKRKAMQAEADAIAIAAEKLKEEARAASESAKAQSQALITAPVQQAAIPDAIRVKESWDYTILDAQRAYAVRPDFFELTPKRKVILDALSAGMRSCNGLNIWKKTEAR